MRHVRGALAGLVVFAVAALLMPAPRAVTAQGGGTLEVEVKYAGQPVVEKLKVNKDTQVCGTEATQEKVRVGATKGLADAVVSVPGAKGSAAPAKAEVDQKGCKFIPHVVALQAGGQLDIKNSDGILHNIHTYSSANPSINKAQPKFKKVMTEKFDKPEIIKLTCDVHSWMLGWIAVMPSPYFAVTGDTGVARIDNVPAGKHRVEVWHAVLGKLDKEVEVKAGQTVKVAFEFARK
jgi:plastocyanin